MKINPVLAGVVLLLGIAIIVFAYRAGQQNPGASFPEGMQAELDRLRADYDGAAAEYADDLKQLRTEFDEKTERLEQAVYGLREQLARAGVELGPMSPRTAPGNRESAAAAPAGPVSKESFYQLRTNMSLQDVERLLGRPGELSYRMADDDGSSTENYRWKWFNVDGTEGQITVTFRNNKLTEKEFLGEDE